MDKAVWVGSEQARSAAMQQFIELKQDTEFWFVLIIAMSVALYIGYRYGEWENANRKGQ